MNMTIEQLKFLVDSLANAHPGMAVQFTFPAPTPAKSERTKVGMVQGYDVFLPKDLTYAAIRIRVVERY